MSTVIRLKNSKFNNPKLPVIASFIERGLKGAWRFTQGGVSSDLSGNGADIQPSGEPRFGNDGLIGAGAIGTGSFITDVADNSKVTLIAIYKMENRVSSEHSSMAIGNYMTSGGKTGIGMWVDRVKDASPGLDIGHRFSWHSAPATPGDETTATLINASNTVNTNTKPDGLKYCFVAMSVDSVTGDVMMFNSASDDRPNRSKSNVIGRTLTLPDGNDAYFIVGGVHSSAWANDLNMEIIEAAVYHEILTDDEILAQYALSKKYTENVRGLGVA